MKKRIIAIGAGAGAIIVALALALAVPRAPAMQVTSVDPDCVVLEADGDCGYFVWLNHAPTCDDCRYYDGSRVISATNFSQLEAHWDAVGLPAPTGGDCFCGHWHCYDTAEWHGGELWGVVAWRVWLPLVMR